MTPPLVFDIARGSFADGPGIRTVVFFKGCPLSCVWCHNPESQRSEQEVFHHPERCVACGECHSGFVDCIADAKRLVGRHWSPRDLAASIIKDKPYFESSKGGVTLSGGEPLLHISYIRELLDPLKAAGVHVAIQTSGHFDFNAFATHLARDTDLVLYDLKIFDPKAHLTYTGTANDLILNNLPRLLDLGIAVTPRIPLVPGITATEENLADLRAYLVSLDLKDVELLRYNPGGKAKWRRLGRPAPACCPNEPLPPDRQAELIRFFGHPNQTA